MLTRALFSLCFILFSLMMITSCEYEIIEFEKPVPQDTISFETDILPIFNNNNCNVAGCHSAGYPIVDLSPANAYKDLFAKNLINTAAPEQSKIYTKLTAAGSTHSGKVTPTEAELILEWIKKGALK